MTKILCVGDLHLKPSQLSLVGNVLSWIESMVAEHEPDMLVYLGDVFDTHAIIRAEVQNMFYEHILRLSTPLMPIVYVVGNHDFYRPDSSQFHALKVFKGIQYLKIVDEPLTFDRVAFIPFVPHGQAFPDLKTEICIAHQDFIGADYGHYRPKHAVDADVLSYEMIISGHIHRRQSFGKVVYPGTPYSMSAVDVDQDKGLMLFDTETYRYSFIESPFPRWRSVELSESSVDWPELNNRDHFILKLVGSRSFIKGVQQSSRFQELIKSFSVSVRTESTSVNKVDRVQIKKSSVKDMLMEYLDKVVDVPEERRSLLKQMAREVIK